MSGERMVCAKCGRAFTWSYEEQRVYAERHLEPPRRCPACRSRRHWKRDSGGRGLAGPPGELPADTAARWEAARRAVLAASPRPAAERAEGRGCLSLLRRLFGPLFRRP